MITNAKMDGSIDWLIDLRIKGGMTAWSVWLVWKIIGWLAGLKNKKILKRLKEDTSLQRYIPNDGSSITFWYLSIKEIWTIFFLVCNYVKKLNCYERVKIWWQRWDHVTKYC